MSLSNADGWEAVFKYTHAGKEYTLPDPIVLFREDTESGHVVGLVLNKGRLWSAESLSNFVRYQEVTESVSAYLPAPPGWWTVSRDRDNPTRAWWWRVLAWQILSDGYGLAAIGTPDTNGNIEPLRPDKMTRFHYDPSRTEEREGPWPWPDEPGDAEANRAGGTIGQDT